MSVDWRQRAACKTGDPDRFFIPGPPIQEVVDTCRGCDVLIPCTFDAIRANRVGVQAGMSRPERNRVRRWDRQARERLEASNTP